LNQLPNYYKMKCIAISISKFDTTEICVKAIKKEFFYKKYFTDLEYSVLFTW